MAKKPIFGLDPEKVDRLLSIGTDGIEGSGPKNKKPRPAGDIAPLRKSDAPDLAASLGISAEQPGSRIGRYRVVSVLGEGGMGIVYLAEQTRPIKRRVALKIIKPGMDSKRVIARFEAERQALALLDHPNIAHVYEAGATKTGRPYFAMEYVEGLPITEHCDRGKLPIEQRLRLFQQVCGAVRHAHQKGIIHRDIKPSNILVSTQDDNAVPKIIDFGVAKAISQPLTERTLYTEQGQLFGTPEYMSPEQADMANEDIDTRSDIYSLGVLLYVLLTGVLPFDSEALRTGGIEHIRQVIRETEPKTPSTRLTRLGKDAEEIAQSRATEVVTLTKRLKRELEWIPLKAMRKERAERYQSASELAADIENYLAGAALMAGPPSAVYRLRKFVRRNRVLVSAVAAVLVVLVGGIIVSTAFAVGQARARARAERQEATSRAVTDFVVNDVLFGVSPYGSEGRQLTPSLLLDTASESIQSRFGDKPLAEAAIRSMLGKLYRLNWAYDIAEQHLERAWQIQREQLGPEHLDTLETTHRLIRLYANQSRFEQAQPLAVQTFEARRRLLGPEHVDTLMSMQDLAWVYRGLGQYEEAEPLQLENLQMTRRVLGQEHRETNTAMVGLGVMYRLQGKFDEAAELFAEAHEISRRVRGPWDPSTNTTALWLAIVYTDQAQTDQAQYDKAERWFIEAVEGRTRLYGASNPATLRIMERLIELYEAWDKPEKAEQWRAKLPGSKDPDEQ